MKEILREKISFKKIKSKIILLILHLITAACLNIHTWIKALLAYIRIYMYKWWWWWLWNRRSPSALSVVVNAFEKKNSKALKTRSYFFSNIFYSHSFTFFQFLLLSVYWLLCQFSLLEKLCAVRLKIVCLALQFFFSLYLSIHSLHWITLYSTFLYLEFTVRIILNEKITWSKKIKIKSF